MSSKYQKRLCSCICDLGTETWLWYCHVENKSWCIQSIKPHCDLENPEACHEASVCCLELWITLKLISLLLLLEVTDFITFLSPVADQGTQAVISIRDEDLKCPLWYLSWFPTESQVEHVIHFTLSCFSIMVSCSAFFITCSQYSADFH